jgi:flavin reductase (DIM6/NTAB) family NADH-FMN oxidoreductase RutF
MTTAPAHPVEAGYRELMGAFPTGVAVVTTLDRQNRPRGLTCSSLSSVTLTPPTLLVCLSTHSGTLTALRERGTFALNLLHSRGRHAAEVFSKPSTVDRFDQIDWRPVAPDGLPWLVGDAFAVAECTVAGTFEVGDHTVVLGEVDGVRHNADVPLLYGLRTFSAWPSTDD